jgi:tRNA (cmo5U34)-methyltransferase
VQAPPVDHTLPAGKWTFDAEVTRVFDDMLARSIPQYEVIRQAAFDVACRYVQPQTSIVDLGCSRGEALAPFLERFGAQNRYVGVETSPPMLEAARERFRGYIACAVAEVRDHDLRRGFPAVAPAPSVVLSVLTLQFVPIEYRQSLVRGAYRALTPGGCLILVEKVLGATADLDEAMTALYRDLKADHGYSREEIDRKRFSLEGVLVPVTARWNEDFLTTAGFRQIDCFWRWMTFAGWVAVKE